MINEFQEVLRKLNNKISAKEQTELILEATGPYIDPTIEDFIKDLCVIDNMGRITATEVLFKMGAAIEQVSTLNQPSRYKIGTGLL